MIELHLIADREVGRAGVSFCVRDRRPSARNDFRTFFIFLCVMCVCAGSARKAPKVDSC